MTSTTPTSPLRLKRQPSEPSIPARSTARPVYGSQHPQTGSHFRGTSLTRFDIRMATVVKTPFRMVDEGCRQGDASSGLLSTLTASYKRVSKTCVVVGSLCDTSSGAVALSTPTRPNYDRWTPPEANNALRTCITQAKLAANAIQWPLTETCTGVHFLNCAVPAAGTELRAESRNPDPAEIAEGRDRQAGLVS